MILNGFMYVDHETNKNGGDFSEICDFCGFVYVDIVLD